MMLWLLLILGTFANVAQAQDNVDATQLQGWQNFFDKTNGGSWTRCRGKRDSPCTCSGGASTVTCQDVDGTLFITSIQLRNNGLSGVNVPGAELESIVGGFSGFTSLDISQNPNLKNTRGGCIRIPSCTTGTATCNVGYTICTDSGTSSPSTTGTTAPTPLVTVPGATAWRRFFDATSGTSWTRCSSTRTAPCNCQRNQVATAPIRVVCTGSVITRISMINNNLNAATFPAQDVSDLIRAGAAYIDLTGNPGLAANESCVNVPECNSGGVICIFEQPLCSTTLSPGISPNTPTTSPSPNNNQTSVSPTSSVPTTSSPSAVGSASPSVTSSPTTISSPPSVAPPPTNTTKSPSVQPGSTGVPTTTSPSSNQTSSPSSSGTRSPTQTPVTKSPTSPTSPVQTSSFSPTPSSSNKIQGITVAASVMSVCLAALTF